MSFTRLVTSSYAARISGAAVSSRGLGSGVGLRWSQRPTPPCPSRSSPGRDHVCAPTGSPSGVRAMMLVRSLMSAGSPADEPPDVKDRVFISARVSALIAPTFGKPHPLAVQRTGRLQDSYCSEPRTGVSATDAKTSLRSSAALPIAGIVGPGDALGAAILKRGPPRRGSRRRALRQADRSWIDAVASAPKLRAFLAGLVASPGERPAGVGGVSLLRGRTGGRPSAPGPRCDCPCSSVSSLRIGSERAAPARAQCCRRPCCRRCGTRISAGVGGGVGGGVRGARRPWRTCRPPPRRPPSKTWPIRSWAWRRVLLVLPRQHPPGLAQCGRGVQQLRSGVHP